jgi:integrase/recombinase XerD
MKVDRFGQAEALSKGEFLKVLGELENHHRLIFALSWYTAERPGSILKLKVEQLYFSTEKRIPTDKIVFPASNRKDRKTREVIVSRALNRELRLYQAPSKGYAFPGKEKEGEHLTYRAYAAALDRVYRKLGMVGYSPYSARRGAITHLMREGKALRVIQDFTGHASLTSLQRYLQTTETDRLAAVEAL